MRLPDFLIIGAMKAGTTTLFRDLLTNPEVFFPIDKEPESLCRDGVLTPAGLEEYGRLFAKAGPDQRCAEASTAYTKLPVFTGVVERAARVLPDHARFLYVVREPVARTLSQHRHEVAVGRLETTPDANEAVRRHPRYLDYSRYAMQLTPWLETFGPERVRVMVFEHYTGHRRETVAAVSEFLGITPRPELVDPERAFNKAEGRVRSKGALAWFRATPLYQRVLRPALSAEARTRLRYALASKVPDRTVRADEETRRWIAEQLADEIRAFDELVVRRGVLFEGSPSPLETWRSAGAADR